VMLARILTPADFGVYGFALATVFLAILPAMWSLAPMLVADACRTDNLHHVTASFAWCIGAVRFAIVVLLAIWFGATGRQIIGWLCLIVGFTESFREVNNVQKAFLEGAGRFEPNLLSIIANIIFCVIVVIPIAFLLRGPFVLTLPSFGMLITDFMVYRYCAGRSVLVRPRWIIPRQFFHSGFWIWLNTMSEIGLSRFDKWFVGRFRGDVALGNYSRAFGYAPLAFLALNSFATNPTLSGLARCKTPSARLHLFLRTAAILVAGGVVNWLIFFFFSREIVLSVFGPQWEETVPVFRAFATLSLAYAVASLPIAVMYSQKRYREVAIVRAAVVLAFAISLFTFRENLSMTGVAWLLQAMLVVQGVALMFFSRSIFNNDSALDCNP